MLFNHVLTGRETRSCGFTRSTLGQEHRDIAGWSIRGRNTTQPRPEPATNTQRCINHSGPCSLISLQLPSTTKHLSYMWLTAGHVKRMAETDWGEPWGLSWRTHLTTNYCRYAMIPAYALPRYQLMPRIFRGLDICLTIFVSGCFTHPILIPIHAKDQH